MAKKAVITGAAGFIGRHLTAELIDNGYQVLAIVREDTCQSKLEALPNGVDVLKCALDKQDLLTKYLLDYGCDVFFHLAWSGAAGKGRSDPFLQMKNVADSICCYQACSGSNCSRFIAVGTIGEYMAELALNNNIISENYIYALSKSYLHKVLVALSKKQYSRFTWCTLSGVYGRGDTTSNLINYTLQALINGEKPTYTSARQPFDFLHVKDIASALRLIGESRSTDDDHFYIGSGAPLPLREYILKIRELVAPEADMGIGERADDGTIYRNEWFDTSRLKNEIGFVAQISFDQGILDTYEWLFNQTKGPA